MNRLLLPLFLCLALVGCDEQKDFHYKECGKDAKVVAVHRIEETPYRDLGMVYLYPVISFDRVSYFRGEAIERDREVLSLNRRSKNPLIFSTKKEADIWCEATKKGELRR